MTGKEKKTSIFFFEINFTLTLVHCTCIKKNKQNPASNKMTEKPISNILKLPSYPSHEYPSR